MKIVTKQAVIEILDKRSLSITMLETKEWKEDVYVYRLRTDYAKYGLTSKEAKAIIEFTKQVGASHRS
jgi:hypothetical protein